MADSGMEPRGAVSATSKYRKEETASRGQKIRTEFGRDRSDDEGADAMSMNGSLKGDTGDISRSIAGGKVPTV